jgi:beta-xylosidase/AraC-like DNA-binding protein
MEGYTRKEKLKISVLDYKEEGEHFHQDIELLYVLEGSIDVSVGDQIIHMASEDILVVNANKKHKLKASENVMYVKLAIGFQLFSDIFHSTNIIIWCDSTKGDNDDYGELRKTIKNLLNHFVSTKGVDNFGHISLCYQIMDLLSVKFMVKESDRQKSTFEDRIQEIDNYIHANYYKQISLNDLSEKLYLSTGYLSRFFKKNYGMNFLEYLNNVRLYHVVDELLYTNLTITRVAYDNGFSTVASLNKVFKDKYGETPSSFRKNSIGKLNEENVQIEENRIEERLEVFLRDDGIKSEELENAKNTEVVCSVRNYSETKNSWNGIINIGSASDLLKSEVQEHLLLLREGLDFKYVRFWNILSKDMLIDIGSNDKEFNFSRLDAILEFLLRNGLKPHIELGIKPKRILKAIREPLVKEENDIKDMDFDSWERLIRMLMRHLHHRYGRDEIDAWHIELWLDDSNWKHYKAGQDYFTVFDKVYEIVKSYSDRIEVGGCGIRMHYNPEDLMEFLEEWGMYIHQPDFLSFEYYGYEKGEIDNDVYSKRTTDNDGLRRTVEKCRQLLDKVGFNCKKIYITEWSFSVSDRNFINDTCFKGAYIIKNIIDCYGLVDEIAYFYGTDRVTEYYDSNELLFGGNGLITKDGILKPAGFAFDFLKSLYTYYIGKGENYLITTDGHDSYQIICHNQKKLNYNYYFSKEDEIVKEHTWKYFEDREILDLKIELKDVSNGTYRVKVSRINENNGSVLNIWGDMDYEKDLSRNDIKYFRRICEPKLTIQKKDVIDNTLNLIIRMEPNEIALVRIKKAI